LCFALDQFQQFVAGAAFAAERGARAIATFTPAMSTSRNSPTVVR